MLNIHAPIKIVYKTPKEFEKLISAKNMKEVGVFPHYSFSDRVTSSSPKFSQYANTCSILDVNDTMVHLAPEQRTHNLLEKIADLIKKEKDEKGVADAFIIGGKVNDNKSFGLFCEIGNVLEKEGADFSMLCGKGDTPKGALDSLCKNGDTFVFTQEYNPELENLVKNEKNPTSERLQTIFEKFYNIIEISPKHIIEK